MALSISNAMAILCRATITKLSMPSPTAEQHHMGSQSMNAGSVHACITCFVPAAIGIAQLVRTTRQGNGWKDR